MMVGKNKVWLLPALSKVSVPKGRSKGKGVGEDDCDRDDAERSHCAAHEIALEGQPDEGSGWAEGHRRVESGEARR